MNKFGAGLATLLVTLGFSLSAATGALAESRAFQLSLTPDIAVHDRDVHIRGVSLGIWSENPQTAVALGIVSGSTGESAGFSWSLLANYADSYRGVQWAPVNYTRENFLGWQSGIVNYTDQDFVGLQTGLVNYVGNLKGVQLGVVNYAETASTGLQLGLVNVIRENRWFTELPNALAPGMVFVNWRF